MSDITVSDYAPFGLAAVLPQFQNMIEARNQQWVKSPGPYNTTLSPGQELAFRQWVGQNKVPFDPTSQAPSDYDMRGFYQALQNGNPVAQSAVDPNDKQMHYPDYWKTPLHATFSNQSQWATPNAPSWNQRDQLVDNGGNVLFDDRAQNYAPFGWGGQ